MSFLVLTLLLLRPLSPEVFDSGDHRDLAVSQQMIKDISAGTTTVPYFKKKSSKQNDFGIWFGTEADFVFEILINSPSDFDQYPLFFLIRCDTKKYSRVLNQISELTYTLSLIKFEADIESENHDQVSGEPCLQCSWYRSRHNIYNNKNFDSMQWLEINWAAY